MQFILSVQGIMKPLEWEAYLEGDIGWISFEVKVGNSPLGVRDDLATEAAVRTVEDVGPTLLSWNQNTMSSKISELHNKSTLKLRVPFGCWKSKD